MNKRTIQSKITTREVLAPLVAQWRAEGKIVGFTSGSFDIIHAGHVSYLEKAKAKCDVLIAAINSDASVQSYKGPDRPIVPQDARVKMMASLESIDYVYTFEERRNRQNLEVIKPSYYIKAGDYTPEQLTSADVVKQYGGDVMILPMEGNFSTTNMVKKILKVYGDKDEEKEGGQDEAASAVKSSTEKRDPQKAVFLDRDGVINKEVEYLHEPEKFVFETNVLEGVRKMQDLGFKIVVVTNQAGIGLGYFTKEQFYKVNKVMLRAFGGAGITLDKIYFCPHGKADNCACRKPKTGMLERGRDELDLDFKQCYILGDKNSDLQAGMSVGCKTIAMTTGHGCKGEVPVTPHFVANDLLEAAHFIERDMVKQ